MKIKELASKLNIITEEDFEKEYKQILTNEEYEFSLGRFEEAMDGISSFLFSLEGTLAEFSEETLKEILKSEE